MITTRDLQIVEFITDFKIASTQTIAQLMFPSVSACRKRLKVLFEQGKVNRVRDSFKNEYIYFIKKPKQFKHSLLITDFYREISKYTNVIYFKPEQQYDYIRPDAVIAYKIGNKGYLAFLEVEISNKGLDIGKYERFLHTFDYKKYFPVFPQIIVLSDKVKDNRLDIKFVNTDFSNLKEVFI